MLGTLDFIKFWGIFFICSKNLKFFKFLNFKNLSIKIKLINYQNNFLGVPELSLKLVYKFFSKEVLTYQTFYFFCKYYIFFSKLRLFTLNAVAAQNSFLKKCIKKNYNLNFLLTDSFLFYTNFNVISINFLFKSNCNLDLSFSNSKRTFFMDCISLQSFVT